MDEIYRMYGRETDFHTHGKVSHTTFGRFLFGSFKTQSKIPRLEARCDYDDNVQYCISTLCHRKVQGIHQNRFEAIQQTLCAPSVAMSNSSQVFCTMDCYKWQCPNCGVHLLKLMVKQANTELLQQNPVMHWLQ